MRHPFFKTAIAAAIFAVIPFTSYAADASSDQVFNTSCLKAWMERAGNTSDKVEFKNFGEKYCACASGKSLNNDAEIDKAARTCMSQTLLQVTMSALETSPGLSNLTEANILSGCQGEWKIVYPDMGADAKRRTDDFCKCAAPKLLGLNKNKDNVTDAQWSDKINEIGDSCSGNVQPSAAPTAKNPT